MEDRELLELAAKAIGLQIGGWSEGACAYFVKQPNPSFLWNPLNNDGDAFRLAVNLDLDMIFYRKHVDICDNNRSQDISRGDFASNNDSKMEAARRAIVHRASEIGKSL